MIDLLKDAIEIIAVLLISVFLIVVGMAGLLILAAWSIAVIVLAIIYNTFVLIVSSIRAGGK